ncbi:probable ubiquitin carboxyl-terminal hydrolase MINDY-4 isoform X2 [Liolophura sinensis]|uniref:probable ubiquitin carboxyl-terminal hydrolase MINDY-4 isoform X2 n=1 Tax=Liolophura sinensis TaxID=3198878 RepID=UPI00315802DD
MYKSSSFALSDVLENYTDRHRLDRRGLKGTLKVMDEELPRCENSISNRQALMKELGLGKLMKRNKEQSQPLRSMLEVMSKSYLDRSDTGACSDSSSPDLTRRARGPREERRSTGRVPTLGEPATDQYVAAKERPSTARINQKISSRSLSSDLVIDDITESETILGEGKGALIDGTPNKYTNGGSQVRTPAQGRPRTGTAGKSRALGMAGPISSNIDLDSRRKFHKPRAYSAATKYSDWRDDLVDSNSITSNSSLSATNDTTMTTPSITSILNSSSSRHSNVGINLTSELSPLNGESTHAGGLELEKSKKQRVRELLTSDIGNVKSAPRIKKRDKDKVLNRGSGAITPPEIEAATYNVNLSSIATERPKSGLSKDRSIQKNRKSSATSRMGDLEIGEVDDLEMELANLDLTPQIKSKPLPLSKSFEGYPIDLQTAVNLKMLIFGSSSGCFNDEWKYQSFTFSDQPHLMYGFVQKKGGPCGVLAAVQAVLLQEMLFVTDRVPTHRWHEPTREERSHCLCKALSKIFWRAGDHRRAVVAMPGRQSHFDGGSRFKEDGLTEKLMLYTFTEFEKLQTFMKDAVRQFELDGQSGVILTLYSAILSRGVDRIVKDMDEATNKLMGAHGYCTQDMVNLLLTGHAVSNVFNDVMELDSGGVGPPMILKGLPGRNDIGLLSLFEHYKSCQVGTYYKTPRFPIWVVCSESHFSVLFSIRKDLVNDWKAERRFDLYYYDGLAKQEEQIRLTIDTTNRYYQPPSDDDLVLR